MEFSELWRLLKQGQKLQRKGWGSEEMFIFLQKGYPDGIPCNQNTAEATGIFEGEIIKVAPYLMMKVADNFYVSGWLPSQIDIFANDWQVV